MEKSAIFLPTTMSRRSVCAKADGKKRAKSSNDWKNRWFALPTIGTFLLCHFFNVNVALASPDGAALMAQLRAALPEIPIFISGELHARDRRGDITRVAPVEMELHWGASPPMAVYTLFDRFGSVQEQVRVTWPSGIAPEAEWRSDEDDDFAPLTDLDQSIDGLDLTWADLTLSFLWWDGGRVVGSERVRGRFCYIVDVPAPEGSGSVYAGARLWVDPETSLMMQVDAYDQRGRMVRRLQVKSIRKINEIWMVQNLDIFRRDTRDRITLRVRNVKALDDSFSTDLE